MRQEQPAYPLSKHERILVAVDGSEFSETALDQAISMAKVCKSNLFALSVIDLYPETIARAPMLEEKLSKETREILERAKGKAAKENVPCETIVHIGGQPHKFIVKEAEEKNIDLIVVGTHGRTGLKRLLMGSVTARVIGHSSHNVLVIPKASIIKWKNIVIATDGSKYSEVAAKGAINLIKRCNRTCTLNVIAVTRKDATKERIQISENALKEIKLNAEKENIKVDTLLVKDIPHESIHKSILKYAKEKDADIIVMGSHGRTWLQRLLMGSVAERVIGHTESAVLVVKG